MNYCGEYYNITTHYILSYLYQEIVLPTSAQ